MSGSLASRLSDAQSSLTTAWETKSHADIDIAITKWDSILRYTKGDEHHYDDILSSYASALLLRWRRRRRPEDIDNAIDNLERSANLQGEVMTLARYENYCNLGAAYLDRWEALEREPADLLTAAAKWEVAHTIGLQIGRASQSANMILPNLGDVYCFAYAHKFCGISVITRAINHYNTALSMVQPEGTANLNYKLGKAHATMFLYASNNVDLRLGHSFLQKSIAGDLSAENKEDAAMELRDMYEHEYEQRPAREALDSAIYWARRAVHMQDEDCDPRALRKVAILLTLLYREFGDTDALDSAIRSYEQTWELSRTHETNDAATFYYNYGTALMRRSSAGYTSYQRVTADLERAIELLQLAVDNAKGNDFLAYEVQLTTAKEKYSQLKVRGNDEADDPSPLPTPPRSATFPRILGGYPRPSIGTASTSRPMRSVNERSSSILGDRETAQASISTEVTPEHSGGRRPTVRQQTLPYQPISLRDPEWKAASPNVEVWTSRTVTQEPTEAETAFAPLALRRSTQESITNQTARGSSLETKAYTTGLSARQRTLPAFLTPAPNTNPAYLSPSLPDPFPGNNSRMPPSSTMSTSLVAALDQAKNSFARTEQQPPREVPWQNVNTGSSAHYKKGSLAKQFGGPFPEYHAQVSSNFSTSSGQATPGTSHSAVFGTNDTSSPSASSETPSIRPTNLTGRIKNTDRFPVDEGGFSSIYKGTFGSTKESQVIRNLTAVDSTTLQKRLRREMDVWWKLDHPNVVPLLGYTDDMGPLPSMISPWYENGNASNYVQKEGLGVEFRLQLLREVSTGLRYLHHCSPPIVHGDLKPGNVLIDNDGVARLCDFGLAHLVSDVDATITATSNVGTIRYAAPELRCPENDDESVRASTQTDIYSLACIAYEFLYQKQPFADKASIQTIIAAGYSHIPPARMETEDPAVLGPTAPHYWELFQSCWDEQPKRRPDIISFCEHVDLACLALAD